MRRRVLLYLALAVVSGCKGGELSRLSGPDASPSNSIADAMHSAGNPDFFFLPPMVPDASSDSKWNAGAFNGTLAPTVQICSMTGTEGATAVDTCGAKMPAQVSLTDELYRYNWAVPNSSTVFYRIIVWVGTKELGHADVETVPNASQLKNLTTQDYVPLADGRTLPVKFRIERYALCTVAGTGPCASSSIDLASGGTVETVLPGGELPSGIFIPGQGSSGIHTFTVEACPSLNPRAIDLPVFGPCVRVTSDPVLTGGFTNPATVFACDVNEGNVLALVNSEEQAHRITLHRLDVINESNVVNALPHATACSPGAPGYAATSSSSLSGMLAALGHGQMKAAARQLGELLSPKPLYAAMFIDLGGGGFTDGLSDFQFALPAKFDVVASTNNQVGSANSALALLPAVQVTDLGGEPVRGATVSFATSAGSGSVAPASNITDVDGIAKTSWTLGTTSPSFMEATGRGIASDKSNGPRATFDPFQPLFGSEGTGPRVLVGTGSVTFTATIGESGRGVTSTVCSDKGVTSLLHNGNPTTVRIIKDVDQPAPVGASNWIAPTALSGSGGGTPDGVYVFETKFTGSTSYLSGALKAEAGTVTVTLNDNPVSLTGTEISGGILSGAFSTGGVVAGTNTLRIKLEAPFIHAAALSFCFDLTSPPIL